VTDVQETPAEGPRTRAPLNRAWVLAGVMTLIALGFAIAWAQLYTAEGQRSEVRTAAEQLVLHLTTFTGESIDEWVQQTQTMATDEYSSEVNELFDVDLRAALRDARSESVGRLIDLFVQDIDGDNATVFAVLRQTITNAATTQPIEDELRMQVELRRESGTWKAARVEVLGPQGSGSGGNPAAPAVPDNSAPEQDSEQEGN